MATSGLRRSVRRSGVPCSRSFQSGPEAPCNNDSAICDASTVFLRLADFELMSNKTLVERYDALLQKVQDRIAGSDSLPQRILLLGLITRLNKRGMKELERRQRAAEEQLWEESLLPAKRRPGDWI
jgi:hypothetical protein